MVQILQRAADSASQISQRSKPVAIGAASCVRLSVARNQIWLKDGDAIADATCFTEAECERAFELGNRCGAATMALLRSLL